jgi:small subunit ribosomal protein S18
MMPSYSTGSRAKLQPKCLGLLTIVVFNRILMIYQETPSIRARGFASMVRKKLGRNRKNRCRFCTKEGCPRPAFVDYKDVQGLKKMCTSQGKLFSRKRSGNCAAFQRAVKDAIKRARFMALMPYVGE